MKINKIQNKCVCPVIDHEFRHNIVKVHRLNQSATTKKRSKVQKRSDKDILPRKREGGWQGVAEWRSGSMLGP